MFSPSSPHFPLQAPPRAQQLRLPVGLVPHLGHLAAVTALAVGFVTVIVVAVVVVVVVVVAIVVVVVVTISAIEVVQIELGSEKSQRDRQRSDHRTETASTYLYQLSSYIDRRPTLRSTCAPYYRHTFLSKHRRERNNCAHHPSG